MMASRRDWWCTRDDLFGKGQRLCYETHYCHAIRPYFGNLEADAKGPRALNGTMSR